MVTSFIFQTKLKPTIMHSYQIDRYFSITLQGDPLLSPLPQGRAVQRNSLALSRWRALSSFCLVLLPLDLPAVLSTGPSGFPGVLTCATVKPYEPKLPAVTM